MEMLEYGQFSSPCPKCGFRNMGTWIGYHDPEEMGDTYGYLVLTCYQCQYQRRMKTKDWKPVNPEDIPF